MTHIPEDELQLDVGEQSHEPLAFLSGAFRGAQLRWAIPDKEGFAVKEACSKLCHFLVRERGFHIYTDHRNLQYIFNPTGFVSSVPKPTADRLERWAMLLRCYDYKIHHIEGTRNVWADLLSRWGAPTAAVTSCARVSFRVGADRIQAEDILETFEGEDHPAAEQWPTDEDIQAAQRGVAPERCTELGLQQRDGRLYGPMGRGLYVPEEPAHLRLRLMTVGHAGAAGHRGIATTQQVVGDRFWWPSLRNDVDTFVRRCLLCIKSRGGGDDSPPHGRAAASQ